MRINNTSFLTAALGALLYGAASVSAAAPSANTPADIAMFSSLQDTSYSQRQEIYKSLPKDEQNNYWIKKLETFRSNQEGLSEDQLSALDRAVECVQAHDKDGLGDVEQVMKDAFGEDKMRKLMATLYLDDEEEDQETALEKRAPKCECSKASDYCDWREECKKGGCKRKESDCGAFGWFDCDGTCI